MHEFQAASSTHRRILKFVLLAAMLVTTTLSCVAFAAAQELVNVRISVDYRLYGSNAPLWYAQDSGLFRAAGINAIVDGMVILDRSAQSIVSLKKANITNIKDLVGRKVGTGQADATSRLFPAVLKVNDIAMEKINVMPVEQRIRDALLLRGDVDAVIGFDSTILFNLMTQKVRVEDTNVIYFADNGFNFYGNGLLVSRAFIESNPDAVKRLTSAVAKAWVASIKNPQATIDALAKRDPLTDVPLEVQRLKWILDKNVMTDATRVGGIGAMDPHKMQAGLKTLAEGFELPIVPTIEDLYDDRFLPPRADRAIPTK